MRILISMLHYHPARPSGSTRLAFDEAVYLSQQGHEVWVVTQDLTHDNPKYSFRDNLHVLQYPSPHLHSVDFRRIQIHQQLTQELLSIYLPDGPEIVHGHSLLHHDGALSFYNGSIRYCYSVHSPVSLELQASSRRNISISDKFRLQTAKFFSSRIESRVLFNADIVTSDSHYTKNLLVKLYGDDLEQKVNVIPGWVDIDRFQIASDRNQLKQELGWPRDIPVLFTLRRLVPRMGLDRMLYALAEVKMAGRDFYWAVGGTGRLHAELEALTKDLGLENQVRFLGFVPEETLPKMYAAADAFVLPTSELECFGLIMLEALASGTPVLATPVAAIPEVMLKIEPCWLAQGKEVNSISELLINYLDASLPTHSPEVLRAFVEENYARDTVLQQMVSLILS